MPEEAPVITAVRRSPIRRIVAAADAILGRMNARLTLAAATVAFVAAGLLRPDSRLTAQAPHAPAMPPVPANLAALETHLADIRMLTDKGENAEAYFSPDGTHLIFQSLARPGLAATRCT